MRKLHVFLVGAVLCCAIGVYVLQQLEQQRALQRAEAAHLLSRCVNESVLSLFRLQGNDWRARQSFLASEEAVLKQAVAQLPEKIRQADVSDDWTRAVQLCDQLTQNSISRHREIFAPLALLAQTELWGMQGLSDKQMEQQRKALLDRLKLAVTAADRYLVELRTDIEVQLRAGTLSPQARELAAMEIERGVLNGYTPGQFSARRALQYLERQQRLYTLLRESAGGFGVRGGSLVFYRADLRQEVDALNRALLSGRADFYNNFRQLVTRVSAAY